MKRVKARYKDKRLMDNNERDSLIHQVESCLAESGIKIYKKNMSDRYILFWVNGFYILELTAKYLWKDQHEYLVIDITNESELLIERIS